MERESVIPPTFHMAMIRLMLAGLSFFFVANVHGPLHARHTPQSLTCWRLCSVRGRATALAAVLSEYIAALLATHHRQWL